MIAHTFGAYHSCSDATTMWGLVLIYISSNNEWYAASGHIKYPGPRSDKDSRPRVA